MLVDHNSFRITLQKSLKDHLDVIGALSDPRYLCTYFLFLSLPPYLHIENLGAFSDPRSAFLSNIFHFSRCPSCRMRFFRPQIMSADQWATANKIFRLYASKYFPDDRLDPVFVPLNDDVSERLADLITAERERQAAAAPIPPLPPPKKARVELLPAASSSASASSASSQSSISAPALADIMDEGVEIRAEVKEEPHGIEWEIREWFSDSAPHIAWTPNPPAVTWPPLVPQFRRISKLALRYLIRQTSSAPSERVSLCTIEHNGFRQSCDDHVFEIQQGFDKASPRLCFPPLTLSASPLSTHI